MDKTYQGRDARGEKAITNLLSLEGARLQCETGNVAPELRVINRVALVLADRPLEARVGLDLGHHGIHGIHGEFLADLWMR